MADLLLKARQLLPALAEVAKLSPAVLLDRGQLARVVAVVSGKSLAVVKKYLALLEQDGAIMVRQTPGGTIEKFGVVGQSAEKKVGGVVVLLDYENLRRQLEERAGPEPQLNFSYLMRCLERRFGLIEAAEAFLPPHLSGKEPLVRALLAAGFHAIVACPRHSLDKDAADNVICERAEFYCRAVMAGVERVVVVSGDQDFRKLVSPLMRAGKELSIYDFLNDNRGDSGSTIEGGTVQPLFERSEVSTFREACREILKPQPLSAGTVVQAISPRAQFLWAVVQEISAYEARLQAQADKDRCAVRHPSFRPLLEVMERNIQLQRWFGNTVFFRHLHDALSALIKEGVVQTREETGERGAPISVYLLNRGTEVTTAFELRPAEVVSSSLIDPTGGSYRK